MYRAAQYRISATKKQGVDHSSLAGTGAPPWQKAELASVLGLSLDLGR
jgi:hypothetical protein